MEDPSQEDVSSIYDDLMGQGDLGLIIHNLQIRNKHLQLHVTSLEEDIQKLCDKITEMKQTQENLSRNISELYKTAKNEIDRKDRLIAELQSRLDDMIFKRNTAPSNFGFKRQREEVTNPGETYKRLRSDVKSEPNREQNKDNIVPQSELPKSSYHNNDKKSEVHEKKRSEVYDKKTTEINQINSEYEVSKNYRNNDTRDNMKHQNFVRNDERKLDIRDHSRYGRDSKRSSNSKNYRRDNERSFRRYNDRDRRSSRDRDYKADRFDEYREAKNKNPRNERLNREHHRSDDREPIGSKREIKNEPRFSSIESTRSTPEFVVEAEDCLNVSREEGEIVDNDSNINPVSSDKSKYDSEINIHKESIVLCDNKRNPPRDKIHKSKSIDKYNTVSEKKETGAKIIEKHNKGEKLDNKHQHFDKKVMNDMKGIVEEKRDNVQIMENVTSKESLEFVERCLKSVKECDVKIISSVDKDSREHKEKSVEKEGVKAEKITIISQVVLNESKTENIESRVGTEVISKEVIKPETNKIGCSAEHKIVKVDKPIRESGVPRNLTGELDINIGKSRLVRDNIKELYADKNERIKKKISSVFDTPIKQEQNLDKSVNFESSFDTTLNGCTTELEKTDAKESVQSNIEIATSTPVSEFQIFKANFHNLEKSNNVKFQTDISNAPMNSAELSTHKIIESKEFNTEPQKSVQDGLNKNISEGILQNLISEDLVNTSQTVKNEKMICANTNDISNISLDLLNTNLAMCKAEDFPNLTSCTESKDMPNLLSTTVSKSSKKIENSAVISSKPLDIENISNKPSTNTGVEENIILKGNNANDSKSLLPRNTANPAVNIPVNPNTGNTRKKRKRCVIGWAQ